MRAEAEPNTGWNQAPLVRTYKISVVIVVWNAQKYVLECLESLREHCRDTYYEVVVVDNASTDGTPELIERLFPEFKLIRNRENLGFAKANNIGISQCSGDYICLVNSDVKFRDNCLLMMSQYLSQNPGIAMIGPKMLWPDGRVRRSTMRFPTVWNLFCRALGLHRISRSRIFGGQLMADFDHESTRAVEVLNGWFVMVRRNSLERVGLLDPQFFMYGEDIDWCYRFHKAGERILFFSGAGAIHYGGASSAKAPIRFSLEMMRADWQYWRKHYGIVSQCGFLGTSFLHHSIRLVGSCFRYVCAPHTRSETVFQLKVHVACLERVAQILAGQDRKGSAIA